MASDDDIDFEAFMRERGVERLKSGSAASRPGPGRRSAPASPQHSPEGSGSSGHPGGEPHARPRADRERDPDGDRARTAIAAAIADLDAARRDLAAAIAERDRARTDLAAAVADRDQAIADRDQAVADRRALAKERAALQRKLDEPAPAPEPPALPTLRQILGQRGAPSEAEAVELLLAMLGHRPADLLDHLEARPELLVHLEAHLVLVCDRPECQPSTPVAVVHVPPERCDVCEGSDIRRCWQTLLEASRRAGVTRLLVVGGSPAYRTQLKALCRGTDLKLELVAGDRKRSRRRARTDAERVVIWGSTELDHATSAPYEHLGDRLIRVSHRGISGMLRQVARALTDP